MVSKIDRPSNKGDFKGTLKYIYTLVNIYYRGLNLRPGQVTDILLLQKKKEKRKSNWWFDVRLPSRGCSTFYRIAVHFHALELLQKCPHGPYKGGRDMGNSKQRTNFQSCQPKQDSKFKESEREDRPHCLFQEMITIRFLLKYSFTLTFFSEQEQTKFMIPIPQKKESTFTW